MDDLLKLHQEMLVYLIDNNCELEKNFLESIIDTLEKARFEIDDLKEQIEQLKEDVDYWRDRP